MPQLGESMAEATIVSIKVQPGDKVSADQEIIEVETDKASWALRRLVQGKLRRLMQR
jgi:pyruvate/2-oxoglutarate dehydrogenase complex dihydrolipoamide acyltransferase (E2) component